MISWRLSPSHDALVSCPLPTRSLPPTPFKTCLPQPRSYFLRPPTHGRPRASRWQPLLGAPPPAPVRTEFWACWGGNLRRACHSERLVAVDADCRMCCLFPRHPLLVTPSTLSLPSRPPPRPILVLCFHRPRPPPGGAPACCHAQLLNRAKPPAEGVVEKKTWQGKTVHAQ